MTPEEHDSDFETAADVRAESAMLEKAIGGWRGIIDSGLPTLVFVVELRDIQLPDTMKRAMAREAEAEREKRAKIIAAEGEALAAGELARAADVMAQHPMALQLRNLQTLVEISVDKNSTVIFPAPLMTTIEEIGSFLTRETKAAAGLTDIIDALKR